MDIRFFDIHSHLNFSQFDDDRDNIIASMHKEGVATICVGTDSETSKESIELAREHDHIWATIGVHPTDWEAGFKKEVFEGLLSERVVGIGECGLDYYRDDSHKDQQRELFEAQLDFAQTHDLPVMLHGRPREGSVDAYTDMLEVLSSYEVTGHVHFFVGDTDIARGFLDRGFTIGFDGPITFSRDYDDVIRFVPLDRVCAETDAPFASPEPYRGRRNNPLYVQFVIGQIAKVRGGDIEEVRAATVANAQRVFGIDKEGS